MSVTIDDDSPLGLYTIQVSASGGGKTYLAVSEILVAEPAPLYLPVLIR
jgi:hypothetical protein